MSWYISKFFELNEHCTVVKFIAKRGQNIFCVQFVSTNWWSPGTFLDTSVEFQFWLPYAHLRICEQQSFQLRISCWKFLRLNDVEHKLFSRFLVFHVYLIENLYNTIWCWIYPRYKASAFKVGLKDLIKSCYCKNLYCRFDVEDF